MVLVVWGRGVGVSQAENNQPTFTWSFLVALLDSQTISERHRLHSSVALFRAALSPVRSGPLLRGLTQKELKSSETGQDGKGKLSEELESECSSHKLGGELHESKASEHRSPNSPSNGSNFPVFMQLEG